MVPVVDLNTGSIINGQLIEFLIIKSLINFAILTLLKSPILIPSILN